VVRRGDFLSQSVDLAVVGAGILGLAVAREALLRHSGLRARVFEKEPQIATHQTGHNSGVIHAGVYYPPGSLKARLCVQGSREIYEYCDEHGISYERCGKVVVATSEDELPRLAEIHRRARANAVPGIELLDAAALAEIEPHVVGLRALHSPATGIVDFRRVANALADDVARLGGELCLNATIVGVEAGPRGVELQTQGETWRAKTVITCAGVYSDRLARMTGAPVAPKIVPFRGRYYSLRQGARSLVHGLVYPVPDPAFPFSRSSFHEADLRGCVDRSERRARPLAEGYRTRDIDIRDLWETVSYSGFRALATKYWRTGLSELRADLSKRAFTAALQRLVPAVHAHDLTESHSGVRAQALTTEGQLLGDFWIDHAENVIHVRNAPSPGQASRWRGRSSTSRRLRSRTCEPLPRPDEPRLVLRR